MNVGYTKKFRNIGVAALLGLSLFFLSACEPPRDTTTPRVDERGRLGEPADRRLDEQQRIQEEQRLQEELEEQEQRQEQQTQPEDMGTF